MRLKMTLNIKERSKTMKDILREVEAYLSDSKTLEDAVIAISENKIIVAALVTHFLQTKEKQIENE